MKRTFTVNEMSEILKKSTATIYDYLKKDKLDGVKVNGVWEINYELEDEQKTAEDAVTDEIEKLSELPNVKTVANQNVYRNKLQNILTGYTETLEEITNHLKKEIEINNRIAEINTPTKFTKTLPKNLNALINNDKTHKYLTTNKVEYEKMLKELLSNYDELDSIIKPLYIEKIHYSASTDSAYVSVTNNNLIHFLNRLSEVSKRFVIVSNDIMTKDIIKIRFSNHIPEYYKKETLTVMRKEREVDVLVPYQELEKNFVVIPQKQTREDLVEIADLMKKVKVVKKYCDKPVNKLNQIDLKRFYELSQEILDSKKGSEDPFVKNLITRQPGILKRISSVG